MNIEAERGPVLNIPKFKIYPQEGKENIFELYRAKRGNDYVRIGIIIRMKSRPDEFHPVQWIGFNVDDLIEISHFLHTIKKLQ